MSPFRVLWLLAVLSLSTAVAVQAQDDVSRARAMANGGRRDEAIALLRQRIETSPADGDALVALGTMLSWEGQYDEARRILEQALERHPTDGDALGALLNVELWSDHPRQALQVAQRGLAEAPNDNRFLQGRQRATDALDLLRPWQVSANENYDWFNDDRTAWKETQAALKRDTPIGSLIVRGSRAQRFSLTDNQFEVEMYPRFRPGTYAYVSAGYAPDKKLYPEYRYAADIYQSLGAGFEGSFGYRRLGFATKTDIYVATMNKYVGNWLLTGRMFYIPDRTGSSSRSYHGSFRRYFGSEGTSYVGARYSRGLARDEIRNINDFEVLASDTVALELQAYLGHRGVFSASGGTSRQERVDRQSLRQHSLSAGLGLRF